MCAMQQKEKAEVSLTEKDGQAGTNGLNDVYKELFDLVGYENMLKLYKQYKGFQVNFPTRLYSKEYVREVVKEEYDGSNTKALARKLGYSERWIRKIAENVLDQGFSTKNYL